MGIRHLIAVNMDGEYKVAQYGQWDGYPGGQGVGVLGFLKDSELVNQLKDGLKKTRFLDADGADKEFIEEYNKNTPNWSNEPDNRTAEQKRWFKTYASRDLGSDILANIAQSEDEEILLLNSISFAGDSLFCEWGYVVDFDKGSFEVFRGFNKEKVSEGRFLSGDSSLENENEYEPIVLVKEYPLSNLPSDDQFFADLTPSEEEE